MRAYDLRVMFLLFFFGDDTERIEKKKCFNNVIEIDDMIVKQN